MDRKIKCVIGDNTHYLSIDEYEAMVCKLHEQGYKVWKISYSFPGFETCEFTEEVTIVGNTKEWRAEHDY